MDKLIRSRVGTRAGTLPALRAVEAPLVPRLAALRVPPLRQRSQLLVGWHVRGVKATRGPPSLFPFETRAPSNILTPSVRRARHDLERRQQGVPGRIERGVPRVPPKRTTRDDRSSSSRLGGRVSAANFLKDSTSNGLGVRQSAASFVKASTIA